MLLEPGDIMANKAGVEHRYRPISEQRWIVRIDGGPDAEMVTTETGRPAGPWAAV